MIDASKGFIKDGNKNRLREQDIRKIVDCFKGFIEMPKYSRMIPFSEIQANDYNLNIPRYIDSSEPEDLQDISAHLYGGIPQRDIDILESYWKVFPSLRTELFKDNGRDGYVELKLSKDNIREIIYHHPEFKGYAESIKKVFEEWKNDNWTKLNEIKNGEQPKQFIEDISKSLLVKYSKISLIDKYDVYQCLMNYWEETMQDDVYAIVFDGWESGRDVEREMVKKKDGTITGKMKSFEGRVIPKALMIEQYFQKEQKAIEQLESERDEIVTQMEEMKEEHGGEEGLLAEVINDKGIITKGELQKRIKEIKHDKEAAEELKILQQYEKLMTKESELISDIKDAVSALDKIVYDQYGKLCIEEIKDLAVEKKWCRTIYEGIDSIYSAISHNLTNRIIELVERYEETLPQVEEEVANYEAKVKSHLERMGFAWK